MSKRESRFVEFPYGISLALILTIVLLVVKFTVAATMPWWVVLIPAIVYFGATFVKTAIFIAVIAFVGVIALFATVMAAIFGEDEV